MPSNPNVTAVSKNNHKTYSFYSIENNLSNFEHFKTFPFCPVYITEIEHIAGNYPIVFLKNTNQDFYIASLFSLLNDINPFINEKNHWTGTYIPAYFRIFPFLLGYSKDKKDPYLCFSTSSNFIHQKLENNLYPFFDKNENLSKELERIFKLLLVVEKERAFLKKSI